MHASPIWHVALGPSGTFLLEAGHRRVPITDVPLGANLLVFYTSRKVKGVKENEIFRIGFLPARQDLPTFVGSLVSVQGGALTFARANQRPWRGYLMPGYYVRGRDGRSYRLQPDEIPLARPFRVTYRTEKCQLPGASLRGKGELGRATASGEARAALKRNWVLTAARDGGIDFLQHHGSIAVSRFAGHFGNTPFVFSQVFLSSLSSFASHWSDDRERSIACPWKRPIWSQLAISTTN